MRIDRLAILHYGPLSTRTFDFSGGREGLHVIYGRNEWGKSLSLQSLEHALFGLPRKLDGFSNPDLLQIEVTLSRARVGTSAQLAFRRRRQSLIDSDSNQPIEETHIRAFLGAATPDTFRLMYGLSAERIREGGQLLLNARGDIANTLFAAATGVERIRGIGKAIDARHEALYSSAGNAVKPHINSAVRAMRRSVEVFSSAVQSPDAIDRLTTQLHNTATELSGIDGSLRQLSTRRSHLNRLRAARAPASELHAAQKRLAALGDPPLLADSFRTRLDHARTEIVRIGTRQEDLDERLSDQRCRRGAITVDDRILNASETIESLLKATGKLEGFDQSIPHRQDEIARLSKVNENLLQQLSATTGQPAREAASRSTETLNQIETLIQDHGGIATAYAERERQLNKAQDRLHVLQEEFATLEVVEDTTAHKSRLATIRDAGDLEKQLSPKRERLASATREHELLSRRLDGRQTEDPVEHLQVPSLDEVREYRERFRRFDQNREAIDGDASKAKTEITRLETAIALLEQEVDLPSEENLKRARHDRDALIQSTRNGVAGGSLAGPDSAEPFQEMARLVDVADDLVDRLRNNADRASQRIQHGVAIEGLRKLIDQLAEDRTRLAAERVTADEEWRDIWKPAHVEPKSPAAMEAWLSTHAECLKQAKELRQLQGDIESLERQIEADCSALKDQLDDLGVASSDATSRLALIIEVGQAIDDRQARANLRRQKSEEVAKAEQELPRLETLLEEATTKRTAWSERWAECMAVLDQPGEVTTDTGRFILDIMRRVAINEDKIDYERDRLAKMEAERTEIYDVMRQVCGVLDREFDPRGIHELSPVAGDRLHANRDALKKRSDLDQEIADTERHLDTLEKDRATAEAVLTTLRKEARLTTNDDAALDTAWERSRDLRELKNTVDHWEQEFLKAAADSDADAFLAECIASSAEAINEELEEIDRRSEEMARRRDTVRDQTKTLEDQVAALGNDRATRAAADCRMHEAEVLARVREYIPLRLASIALERAIRRYRDEHHVPLLSRASVLFQRITGGRYSEIRLAENDLYAVRADATTESVLQRYMSEGTRDQIYLALRLAALEHSHDQGAEPLPLILDDGLVQFDDERTAAMLQVLAEVSAGMQVIVFTHHASVVSAARSLQATLPDTVFLHGEAA